MNSLQLDHKADYNSGNKGSALIQLVINYDNDDDVLCFARPQNYSVVSRKIL